MNVSNLISKINTLISQKEIILRTTNEKTDGNNENNIIKFWLVTHISELTNIKAELEKIQSENK